MSNTLSAKVRIHKNGAHWFVEYHTADGGAASWLAFRTWSAAMRFVNRPHRAWS